VGVGAHAIGRRKTFTDGNGRTLNRGEAFEARFDVRHVHRKDVAQ